jgi:hypothetical protein
MSRIHLECPDSVPPDRSVAADVLLRQEPDEEEDEEEDEGDGKSSSSSFSMTTTATATRSERGTSSISERETAVEENQIGRASATLDRRE